MTNRVVQCPICDKQLEARNGFAYETLNKHIKSEHKEAVIK